MDTRERFEAWAKAHTYFLVVRNPNGEYVPTVETAWSAFQAAERAAVRRCAEICEESMSPFSDIKGEFPEHFKD